MRIIWTLILVVIIGSYTNAQTEIPLYQGKIPNSRNVPDPERVVERGEKKGRAFAKTAIPTLAIFQPPHPNGKAVIICPGGGYAHTAYDKEGIWVAQKLLEDSITAFVLKYRIPQSQTNEDPSLAPLQDAQQAIRFVRKQAEMYQLEADKIGIMGFSAGGHLAAATANHFNIPADSLASHQISIRPDFVALVYPVISFSDELTHLGSRTKLVGSTPDEKEVYFWSIEYHIKENSPPAFLVHAADDKAVSVKNSLAYYEACLDKGVSVEMHLYPEGGHGFGLSNETTEDVWLDRFRNWLKGL